MKNPILSLSLNGFALKQLPYFIISLFLFFVYKKFINKKIEPENTNNFFLKYILSSSFVFCSLFAVGLLIKAVALLLPRFANTLLIEKPDTFVLWINVIIGFLLSAASEELMYRYLVPDILIKLCSRKSIKKWKIYLCEIAGAIVFSIPHYYLGLLGVINAFICQFLLRFFYKKYKTLIPLIAGHFLYNLVNLLIL